MGIFDKPKTGIISDGPHFTPEQAKEIALAATITYGDPNRIILYQTEYIAILQNTNEKEFIPAFDNLTKAGYRLMAIDTGRFYSQKLK